MKKSLFYILLVFLFINCGGGGGGDNSTNQPTPSQPSYSPSVITGTIFMNSSTSNAPAYNSKSNANSLSSLTPFANAVITLEGTAKSTTTDNDGYFSIDVSGSEIGNRTLRIVKNNINLTFQTNIEEKKSYLTNIKISNNNSVYSLNFEKEENNYTTENTIDLISNNYLFEFTSNNPENNWISRTNTGNTFADKNLDIDGLPDYKIRAYGDSQTVNSMIYACTDTLKYFGVSDNKTFYWFDTPVIFSHYKNMKLGKIYTNVYSLSGQKSYTQDIFLGFDTIVVLNHQFTNCVKIKNISGDGSYSYNWYYKGIGNIKQVSYTSAGNFRNSKEIYQCNNNSFALNLPFQKKNWTVMLYGCTDNSEFMKDLTSQIIRNEINSLKNVGSGSNLNIICQIDTSKDTANILSGIINYDTSNPRLYLTQEKSYILKNFGNLNSGNPDNLVEYVKYCKTNFPADSYILIFVGHGSGSVSNFYAAPSRIIGYDDTQKDYLSYSDLQYAFSNIKNLLGKKLDLLVLNSCLMSNIETVYEIKDYVDYIIASEKETYGFRYNALSNLKTNPDLTAYNIGKSIIDNTYDFYNNFSYLGYKELTISLINTAAMDNTFIQTFKDYVSLFKVYTSFSPAATTNMLISNNNNSPYNYNPQIDLFALLQSSQNISGYSTISTKAATLYSYKDILIPYFKKTNDLYSRDYRGISIFFNAYNYNYPYNYDVYRFWQLYINSGSTFNNDMKWSDIGLRFCYPFSE